jgi:hypothetical protein
MRGKVAKQLKRIVTDELKHQFKENHPDVVLPKRILRATQLLVVSSDEATDYKIQAAKDVFKEFKKAYRKSKTVWKDTPRNVRQFISRTPWFRREMPSILGLS